MTSSTTGKVDVHDFWNSQSCGEAYAEAEDGFNFSTQERIRYALEPYIFEFARFGDAPGRDVLEIGVGMGADHLMWARAKPKSLSGIDLTSRAIDFTRDRLTLEGFASDLRISDAENLPFESGSFDIVYSWGVMHHSPDTQACFREAARVLRPAGVARVMVYNTWSIVGAMLWLRYGLLSGRPLRPMGDIYAEHLESPGTKAYTPRQAQEMFRKAGFRDIRVRVQLSHGDLLQGEVGARHQGAMLRVAKGLWPRSLLRRVGRGLGLYLLVEARV